MRGIYTNVNDIRKRVYAEIAKLSYNYQPGDLARMNQLPYNVIPGVVSTYRESAFLERAIVEERARLAMGLNVRSHKEYHDPAFDAYEAIKPETYYKPPLINVIKFACHRCPDNTMLVTEACQGCLAHPCREVCPKDAIQIRNGRSVIDKDKCIKCGKCKDVCPYGAILKQQRPCVKACGMKAITSDADGCAEINQDKCVSCGQCLTNCPFGAIADKAQIFQTIQAIRSDVPVYAAIAPAVTGQFGPELDHTQIRSAFKALGFEDVVEVAIGADLCTIQEANDFLKEVPSEMPFMATSCCPAWAMMAKKQFPEQAKCISMALTPMVLTARMIKQNHPEAKVAFIGPCTAKKLEAMRRSIRSDVDFVLTFEEVQGMFEAKNVVFNELEKVEAMHGASADGRGFAVAGGVAKAVVNYIHEKYPEKEIKVASAESLEDCRKLLTLAKAGKYNGYLLEGMACPGGCIAGASANQPVAKTAKAIAVHQKVSSAQHANESNYQNILELLTEESWKAPEEE